MPELEHKEALQLIEDDWRADADNRDDALEDLRFVAGDQWTLQERTERENAGRPCLTINRMGGFVNQVAGDIRQSQPGMEVFPVDGQEDVTTAKIFEGLIRQVEYQSGAQSVYAHGVESSVRAGIGHWRIITEFTQDSVFEQDIKLKRILDPLSVIWDANAVEIDRSDAKRCWVTEWVHKHAFKDRFGEDRSGVNVDTGQGGHRSQSELYWQRDDFIRIAEYWYLKDKQRNLVLTQTGQTIDVTDFDDEMLIRLQASGQVIKARKVDGFEVKRRIMDGKDWLGDEESWAGRFIPIIPCLGAEIAFDGKIVRHGLIRFAKDAQKLYNFWRSQSAEAIAKAPKAPWLVTPRMIEDFEQHWSNANRTDSPYLPFNVDDAAPTLAPQRQQPPAVPAAMWTESANASEDMKATTGIFDASLGAQGNETSGRAILARQREGDTGSFLYTDNFLAAMRRTGVVLVDLIPRIYDTQRQVRILDIEGNEQFVPINHQIASPAGEQIIVNDLSHGRFDVRVSAGASYMSSRVEAREQIATAMQGNPALWQIIGDLFFKNSDYPGAQEIAERMRRAIPPQLLGEEAEEQPDPMGEAVQRMALADQAAKTEKTEAETRKIEAEADEKEIEVAAGVGALA